MEYTLPNVMELFHFVWMEALMIAIAVLGYFTISSMRRSRTSSKTRKGMKCADQGPPSANAFVVKLLKQGHLDQAIVALRKSPESVAGAAPRLLVAASRSDDFEHALSEIQKLGVEFDSEALEGATSEASSHADAFLCHNLYNLSVRLSIIATPKTLKMMAKVCSRDPAVFKQFVADASAPLARPFAEAVLEVCAGLKENGIIAEVFEKVDESDAPALREFVEKVSAGGARRSKSMAQKDTVTTARAIRSLGKNGDLFSAVDAFERARRLKNVSTLLYNSILDACIDCAELEKGASYFKQAREQGFVDAVSYNMLMKGHLARGEVKEAEALLSELRRSGVHATAASYNGLVGHQAQSGNRRAAWRLVDEMCNIGVVPGAVTCSILLRGPDVTAAEVERVMALINTSKEPMDEVLFTCVVEACVRTGCLQLLAQKKREYLAQGSHVPLSAPTYGAMIKAYGQAGDLESVWSLWREMEAISVMPTQITFGCMVEALVTNGAAQDSWDLTRMTMENKALKPLVNAVIYSTVLKGFANSRHGNKALEVYKEMRARGITPNTITYNTILNACAQSSAMHHVPSILEDMRCADPPVEPDLVTYSTLVKGFCANGDLDRGLEILREIKKDNKHAPDEVMYNSLLDGCAKEHRLEDALRLISDMKRSNVAPSNYTLSMLVKLMGRCRRLGQAFVLIEELSREHDFKLNIQVYTCLIQACFKNRQVPKAIALHERLIKEGLRPDQKLYTAIVRGCLHGGATEDAVRLIRHAYSLSRPKLAAPTPWSKRRGSDSSPGLEAKLVSELWRRFSSSGAPPEAAALLKDLAALGLGPGPNSGAYQTAQGEKGTGRSRKAVTIAAVPEEAGSTTSTATGSDAAESAASL